MGTPKLSKKQWTIIREKATSGHKASHLAKEFGINESTIRLRAKKEDWENIFPTSCNKLNTLAEGIKSLAQGTFSGGYTPNHLQDLENEIAELRKNQLPIIHRRMLLFSKMTDDALNVAIENIQALRTIAHVPTRIASTSLAVRTLVDIMKMVGYQPAPHESQEYLPTENNNSITVNLVRKEIKTDT